MSILGEKSINFQSQRANNLFKMENCLFPYFIRVDVDAFNKFTNAKSSKIICDPEIF